MKILLKGGTVIEFELNKDSVVSFNGDKLSVFINKDGEEIKYRNSNEIITLPFHMIEGFVL